MYTLLVKFDYVFLHVSFYQLEIDDTKYKQIVQLKIAIILISKISDERLKFYLIYVS